MQSFNVTGMSCDHCAASIRAAIQLVDPEASVDVDVAGGKVVVTDGAAPQDVLLEAIASEGYEATPAAS